MSLFFDPVGLLLSLRDDTQSFFEGIVTPLGPPWSIQLGRWNGGLSGKVRSSNDCNGIVGVCVVDDGLVVVDGGLVVVDVGLVVVGDGLVVVVDDGLVVLDDGLDASVVVDVGLTGRGCEDEFVCRGCGWFGLFRLVCRLTGRGMDVGRFREFRGSRDKFRSAFDMSSGVMPVRISVILFSSAVECRWWCEMRMSMRVEDACLSVSVQLLVWSASRLNAGCSCS